MCGFILHCFRRIMLEGSYHFCRKRQNTSLFFVEFPGVHFMLAAWRSSKILCPRLLLNCLQIHYQYPTDCFGITACRLCSFLFYYKATNNKKFRSRLFDILVYCSVVPDRLLINLETYM